MGEALAGEWLRATNPSAASFHTDDDDGDDDDGDDVAPPPSVLQSVNANRLKRLGSFQLSLCFLLVLDLFG